MKCNFCQWSSKWAKSDLSFCPKCGLDNHLVGYNPMPVFTAQQLGMD